MNENQTMNAHPLELLNELLKEKSPQNKVFAQHDLMLEFVLDHVEEFLEHLQDTVEVLKECDFNNIVPYAEKMRDDFAVLVDDRNEFNEMISKFMNASQLNHSNV